MTRRTCQLEPTSTKKPLTRKQALAALHHFYNAYAYKRDFSLEQFDQDESLRTQVREALRVLTPAIHGTHRHIFSSLCGICYLHYGDHFVKVKHDILEYVLRDCCDSCLSDLRAKGLLFEGQKEAVQP